jgi:anti-anti-sigma regulatory factor
MWIIDQRSIEPRGVVFVVRPDPLEMAKIGGADRWQSLDHLVSVHPGSGWIVEVSSEPLLTSTALASLAGILRRLQVAGGKLSFVDTQPGVANVLRSMRLSRMISMVATVDEGVVEMARAMGTPLGTPISV